MGTLFNIVLVEPQIPPNTGSIGRMCVNLDATLHLIEPLGFDISENAVKRAGLDYWSELELKVWKSVEEFLANNPIEKMHFATTKTDNLYWNASYDIGDYIVFGSETKGIPEWLLKENLDKCITIPMGQKGRSLNLATSTGIVTYEALRQNYDSIDFSKITIEFKG
jgi:tRNA (cytidine/uridine-2'-O-)-methyltransferase